MDEALTRLGMPVPDSALARRARELITDVAAPFLVNHSVRSYAWAVELARLDRLQFDPEIIYVSEAGEPEARARAIYDVIALHNYEELPPDPGADVLRDSAGVDATGDRFADVRPAIVPGVLAAYPWLDFKRGFAALFADQASRKPTCPAAQMAATGMLEAIAQGAVR